MKNLFLQFFIVLVASFSLIACSTNTQKQNTVAGGATGAVLGGLAGSAIGAGTGQIVAAGVGAVAGALLGGYIGHSMDHSDNSKTSEVLSNNATNQPSHWKNRKTGAHYTVTPTSNVTSMSGNSHCRNFTTKALINGKKQEVSGTACQQANGSWKTINA